MSGHRQFLEVVREKIAVRSARLGAEVVIDVDATLDRGDIIDLGPAGLCSPNRACRLLAAADNWIAVNLPREEDVRAVPALIGAYEGEPWSAIAAGARTMSSAALVAQAELLGLAVAMVGETPPPDAPCRVTPRERAQALDRAPTVVDLSSLWAGPLCGAVLAEMGAEVTKIDSVERPDSGLLDGRLSAAKQRRRIALKDARSRADLWEEIARCEVLITSARARALAGLGLEPARVFAANPALVWIAITGHGWASARIAFGDDAAAAGGLLAWRNGTPAFIGDALADPLTGLAAAAAALGALESGHGAFIDAALAPVAAYAVDFGERR